MSEGAFWSVLAIVVLVGIQFEFRLVRRRIEALEKSVYVQK